MSKLILLADDDKDDSEMFGEALATIDREIGYHWVNNGKKALDELMKLSVKPTLIFLDINMPVMDGWQCLSSLKADPNLQKIPVVIISTSSYQNDIDHAASMGATFYFIKPSNFNDLKKELKVLVDGISAGVESARLMIQEQRVKFIRVLTDLGKYRNRTSG